MTKMRCNVEIRYNKIGGRRCNELPRLKELGALRCNGAEGAVLAITSHPGSLWLPDVCRRLYRCCGRAMLPKRPLSQQWRYAASTASTEACTGQCAWNPYGIPIRRSSCYLDRQS